MSASFTRAEEVRRARAALEQGEFSHAMHHLGGALAEQLDHPEHLELLEELACRGPENLPSLVRANSDGTALFYGTAAVKAWLLRKSGDATGALVLAAQALPLWPDQALARWLDTWLADPAFLQAVRSTEVVYQLGALAEGKSGAQHSESGLRILRAMAGAHPEVGELVMHLARALRVNGRLEEAISVARQSSHAHPSFHTYVALGTALRMNGEFPEAIEAFRHAARHRPDDEAVWLDIGDLYLELRNLADAALAYLEAQRLAPANLWAQASLAFIQHRERGDSSALLELQRLSSIEGASDRARALMIELEPWVRGLPYTGEASLRVLPRLIETPPGPGSTMKLGLSAIEAPSALQELRLHLRARQPTASIAIAVSGIQRPDPRKPIRRSLLGGTPKVVLWRYEGTDATPAVALAAPPEALVALAKCPYDLNLWSARAKSLHASLPSTQLLLSSMVGVRELPPNWATVDWILRVQIAVSLVIAHRGERAILRDLAYGPMDWCDLAAILALGQLAVEHPEHDAQIATWLSELLPHRPVGGHWPLEHPLLSTLLRLKSLRRSEREALLRLRTELEGEDRAGTE